jgi:hypothetical protein
MNSMTVPNELAISVEGACDISLECWRLSQLAELQKDNDNGAGLRHAARRITETLNAMGIEIIDFVGRPYDPGLVPEVVEVRQDENLPRGRAVIEETVAPTVTWRGQVVSAGRIVVKQSPIGPQEFTEVTA